jgi:lipid II:glycine glycyltransferase (peptidoglycan interpeptide bridge formation enzyme)
LNTGFTILVDLSQLSVEDFRKQMTVKHRYYNKKARNNSCTWEVGNDLNLMTNLKLLHDQMVTDKNLASISLSETDLNAMYEQLKENILIVQGSMDNQPAVICLVLIFGTNAFYMVAAANALGRQNSASYAMIETLVSELSARGVQSFDFGGLDPVNLAAAGVNHFKSGFGGSLVEQVGEWEYSRSQLLRALVNGLIGIKGGRS